MSVTRELSSPRILPAFVSSFAVGRIFAVGPSRPPCSWSMLHHLMPPTLLLSVWLPQGPAFAGRCSLSSSEEACEAQRLSRHGRRRVQQHDEDETQGAGDSARPRQGPQRALLPSARAGTAATAVISIAASASPPKHFRRLADLEKRLVRRDATAGDGWAWCLCIPRCVVLSP